MAEGKKRGRTLVRQIQVRVSESQAERLFAAAAASGHGSVSSFVRVAAELEARRVLDDRKG